jgi:hypothetical protein
MGQYYLIVNLDKKQFLHPHKCGDGLKLLEFGTSANGTLTAPSRSVASRRGAARCPRARPRRAASGRGSVPHCGATLRDGARCRATGRVG